jgi:type II secretory pathway pseudopilin PulG
MKNSSPRLAFTLLEMLIVSATIIALSGMVLGLSYRSIKNAMQSNKTVEILSILRTGINQAATEGRSVTPVKHPLLVQSLELDSSTQVMPPWEPMDSQFTPQVESEEFPIYNMEYGKCKGLARSSNTSSPAPDSWMNCRHWGRFTECPPM